MQIKPRDSEETLSVTEYPLFAKFLHVNLPQFSRTSVHRLLEGLLGSGNEVQVGRRNLETFSSRYFSIHFIMQTVFIPSSWILDSPVWVSGAVSACLLAIKVSSRRLLRLRCYPLANTL